MHYDTLAPLCMEALGRAKTVSDAANIRIAARLAWEHKEMGGLEHVQFAYRNRTPIVPIGHCCHPLELVKRGYIDGEGWPMEMPKTALQRVHYFKWPDGSHWYASIDNRDIGEGKHVKFNTQQEAEDAAIVFIAKHSIA